MGLEKERRKFIGKGKIDALGGLYSRGVPVFGSPGMMTSGSVFHVSSTGTGASDSNGGLTPDQALITIDAAINKCTANKGDLIVVHENHAETISADAAIDCDVAGISIVGLGQGASRPTITLDNTASTVEINAANVRLENLLFLAGVDSITKAIHVIGDDFHLVNCEFREASAKQMLIAVNVGAANNDADRGKYYGNKFVSLAAGAASAIKLAQLQDAVEIVGNYIDGDYSDAGIHNPTGEICTHLLIADNIIRNRNSGNHAIELVSACTGECIGNRLFGDTEAAILDPGSLFCIDNLATDAIDLGSYEVPVTPADQAANMIGADNANNDAATTNVVANEDGSVLERLEQIQEATNKGTGTALATNESLVDVLYGANGIVTYPAAAVPGNGVSIAEVLRDVWDAMRNGTGGSEPGTNKSIVDAIGFDGAAAVTASAGMLRTMAGTTFVVKKTLTSSAIPQAGVDVTAVSTVGDIQIIDVLLQCDATGLAAGTNFTLETNNTKGGAVFLSTAVSGLGANTLMDLDSASVTSKTVVLESGKKVVAKMTVADGTGAGTVDVYLVCRRLADNATLTAA